ncbi:hypothetical protein C4572_04130 [Candidatus Parcubacteria bacterium]|nr:MAG: hypothetical protein C4572_04130 [Candidatus Parcubacteria bacterium]
MDVPAASGRFTPHNPDLSPAFFKLSIGERIPSPPLDKTWLSMDGKTLARAYPSGEFFTFIGEGKNHQLIWLPSDFSQKIVLTIIEKNNNGDWMAR